MLLCVAGAAAVQDHIVEILCFFLVQIIVIIFLVMMRDGAATKAGHPRSLGLRPCIVRRLDLRVALFLFRELMPGRTGQHVPALEVDCTAIVVIVVSASGCDDRRRRNRCERCPPKSGSGAGCTMAGTSTSLSGLLARFELSCANAVGRAILVVGNVLGGEGQDCKRTTEHFGGCFVVAR
jgi:hypothetical protein